MKFLMSLFKKQRRPITLEDLYFRLCIREIRMSKWEQYGTNAPEVVVQADRVLLAKVKKEIEECHSQIKIRAENFSKI